MSVVLITRPEADAEPLAEQLRALGYQPLVAPVMAVRPVAGAALPDLARVQGLLFTSANGVRAFAALSDKRDLAVFAVGAATAAAAEAVGFAVVIAAEGDVASLATTVITDAKPEDGRLLHVSGREVAGDLAGLLGTAGFDVVRAVVYEAVPVEALPAEAEAALEAGSVDYVLVYSPRSARLLAQQILTAKLTARLHGATAVCLSKAASEPLVHLGFKAVAIADSPDQPALLRALDALRKGEAVATAPERTPAPSEPEPTHAAPGEPSPASTPAAGAGEALPTAELLTIPAPARRGAGVAPWLAGALGAVCGAALTIATAPTWLPLMVPPPDFGPVERRLAALERGGAPTSAAVPAASTQAATDPRLGARLEAVERSLQALAARSDSLAAATAPSVTVPDLTAVTAAREEVERLANRLAALESAQTPTPDLSPLEQRLGRLAEQIAAVQQRQVEAATSARGDAGLARRAAQALAVAQVADAAGRGGFQAPLTALIALLEGEARALAQGLSVHAGGVASLDSLVTSFPEAALAAKRQVAAAERSGWQGEVMAFLTGLVVVRRTGVGDDAGTDLDSRLARATTRLEARDLAGALAALDGVDAAASRGLAPWISAARARLEVERVLGLLSRQAVQGLADASRGG